MRWSRGHLVLTRDVKAWSEEEQDRVHEKEKQSVFDQMHPRTNRRQICWVNPSHPDYEKNMDLILSAPHNKHLAETRLEERLKMIKGSLWKLIRWWMAERAFLRSQK